MTEINEKAYITIGNYKLFYNNKESVMQTIDEIFSNHHYAFEADTECPIILDCGSNIGIATFYFKAKYPAAKITCFEPDPAAFAKLKKNIAINKFQDITLVQAALSNKKGNVDFYGQINVKNPDTRGNSIYADWGIQRPIASSIRVSSICLSDYITSEIDLLKLNVEGAEQLVLEEIGDKLNLIKQAIIEVHVTEQMQSFNNLEKILAILERYNFICKYQEQDTTCIWHDSIKNWVDSAKPKLYSIKAKRN